MNRSLFGRSQMISGLYSEVTFYPKFVKDLRSARSEVVIESPFITERRFSDLLPAIAYLRSKNVSVTVNTRNPDEHDGSYVGQAYDAVAALQELGVRVLYTTKLHRKLAVIDNEIVWEGSLNILSFNDSCELMRRSVDAVAAHQTLRFLKIYN